VYVHQFFKSKNGSVMYVRGVGLVVAFTEMLSLFSLEVCLEVKCERLNIDRTVRELSLNTHCRSNKTLQWPHPSTHAQWPGSIMDISTV